MFRSFANCLFWFRPQKNLFSGLLFLPAVFLASGGNAFAWGDTGHKIVCEIAMRLALPSTRAEIRRLLKADDQFDFFRDSCTWPDHPHARPDEHFINLPRDSAGLTADACPAAEKCLLTAIPQDLKILSSDTASDDRKLASLKFLGHWVGDIHQPLHVSFEDDRGGNNIFVSGECTGKLHSVWDTCLVETAFGDDVTGAATELLKTVTPAKQEKWTHSDPVGWANESFAAAEDAKTKYCVMRASSCELASSGRVKIDQDYLDANLPVVRERLQKAGVRLAHMLDSALGK
jgi:hypothetical protein